MMTSLRVLAILPLVVACSSTVDGTGPAPQKAGPETPLPRPSDDVDTTETEQMFEPPAFGKATPNDIIGLWSTGTAQDQRRLLIRPDSMTLARRCRIKSSSNPQVEASVSAAARVDENQTSVAVLEGRGSLESADGTSCTVNFIAGEVARCGGYQSTNCFHFPGSGTQLVFLPSTPGTMGSIEGTWVKVID